MTKSTITRERIQRIIRAIDSEAYDEEEIREWLSSDELMELSRMALAAFDSEPVPKYPEVLPCSVLLEPGLRFGKGIKTSTMLAALARRAVYESDMAALSPEERAEFQARIEEFKSLIAPPAPTVSDERDKAVDADDHPLLWSFNEGWNACRSAMLQASPVCTCPSGDGSLRWPCPVHPGNSPAISDSARDALEKALAAMEFMGDTLNNLDAVCTEDVELVAPAFDAVRSVLAAALQEGK
ncbi:TPA: hypothetical protein ACT3KN_001720 [Klebsiella quasipneumoniae subsp. similipneumoniae]